MYGDTYMQQFFNAVSPNSDTAPKSSGSSTAATGQATGGSLSVLAPIVLVVVALAYLLWAAVQQHERVRESLAPANIAVNLHNLFVMFLTVWLSFTIVKIFLAKLVIWHVPGAKGALNLVSVV